MTYKLNITFTFILCILFMACSNKATPENSVMAFLKHLQAMEFKDAQSYADANTKQLLEALYLAGGDMSSGKVQSMRNLLKIEPKYLKSAQCSIKDQKALCMICCDNNQEQYPINMVKQGNDWLVSMGKESSMNPKSFDNLFENMEQNFEGLGNQFEQQFEQLDKMMSSPQFQNTMQNMGQQMEQMINSPQFQNTMQNIGQQMQNTLQSLEEYMQTPQFKQQMSRMEKQLMQMLSEVEVMTQDPEFQQRLLEITKNIGESIQQMEQYAESEEFQRTMNQIEQSLNQQFQQLSKDMQAQ